MFVSAEQGNCIVNGRVVRYHRQCRLLCERVDGVGVALALYLRSVYDRRVWDNTSSALVASYPYP
jgi:hypothetical protein